MELHEGGKHVDSRGSIEFYNSFHLDSYKRFYIIEASDPKIIRAWHAHRNEAKAFLVLSGSFELAWVKIDNFDQPSEDLHAESMILNADNQKLKELNGGYANGFRALQANSKILVFSDASLEASKDDDYRYDASLWYNW